MPSFDIVSEPDMHEVKNACDQATRELAQRYDFRNTASEIKEVEDGFELSSNSEERVRAVFELLREKFVKRKISLKFLQEKEDIIASGSKYKISVSIKKGIDKDNARNLVTLIKNEKSLKLTPSIQGDTVRVTGKKRDDLQALMGMLKNKDLKIEISFGNFRD